MQQSVKEESETPLEENLEPPLLTDNISALGLSIETDEQLKLEGTVRSVSNSSCSKSIQASATEQSDSKHSDEEMKQEQNDAAAQPEESLLLAKDEEPSQPGIVKSKTGLVKLPPQKRETDGIVGVEKHVRIEVERLTPDTNEEKQELVKAVTFASEKKDEKSQQLAQPAFTTIDNEMNRVPSAMLKDIAEKKQPQASSSIQRQNNLAPSRKISSRRSLASMRSRTSSYKSPAELLASRQPLFVGDYNTMDVFETLPSKYTEEKWKELQAKKRSDLSFEHLYWLSRFEPKNQDGHHLEALIDNKIQAVHTDLRSVINPMQVQVGQLSSKMTTFDRTMAKFRNEVANINNLRNQMQQVIDDNMELSTTLKQMDLRIEETSNKTSNVTLDYARRIGAQEKKLADLDVFVHKPNNFLEMMQNETEKIDARLTQQIKELSLQIEDKNIERIKETKLFEEWQQKQEEFYKLNSQGLKELKAEFATLGKKFEIFERVSSEFQINIEALKTHALATDLHLESTMPMQIASIAFEVGIGAIMKKQYPKFRNNFRKRVRVLQKNFNDCSDPFLEGYQSLFRKNFYELPDEYVNPTKFAGLDLKKPTKGSHSKNSRHSDSVNEGNESPRRPTLPMPSPDKMMRRGTTISGMDKTLADLESQRNSSMKNSRLNSRGSGRNSRTSSQADGASPRGVNADVPKSISKQLLETLTKWQPVDSKWTIKELYERVSQSVTDFLKIPMMEMSSEEFYSLYMDVDNQELGMYKPLPAPKPEEILDDGEDIEQAAEEQKDDDGQQPINVENLVVTDDSDDQEEVKGKKQPRRELAPNTRQATLHIPNFDESGKPVPLPVGQAPKSALKTGGGRAMPEGENRQVTIPENPVAQLTPSKNPVPQLQLMPTQVKKPPAQFQRLRNAGNFQDPRAMQQQAKLERAEQLAQAAERRKLQEQVTDAIETVVNRIEITEQTAALRFQKLKDENANQQKQIQDLEAALKEEQEKNKKRQKQKKQDVASLQEQIEASRQRIKNLVGELEESITEQIKIPQLQLLHTEYQRLREIEAEGVDFLLKRKAEIKAFQQANGGKTPKDDGQGIVVRKRLTGTRTKLRIVQKKIKKYGELGKIPMGASMRVYQEESSSSESSVESSSESEQRNDDSFSSCSFSNSEDFNQKILPKKARKEILATGLVYQPTFKKVVKRSSMQLKPCTDLGVDQIDEDEDEGGETPSAHTPAIKKLNQERRGSVYSKSKTIIHVANEKDQPIELSEVGSIDEVDSISDSSDSEDKGSMRVEEEVPKPRKTQLNIENVDTTENATDKHESKKTLWTLTSQYAGYGKAGDAKTPQDSNLRSSRNVGQARNNLTSGSAKDSVSVGRKSPTKNSTSSKSSIIKLRLPPSKQGDPSKFQSSESLNRVIKSMKGRQSSPDINSLRSSKISIYSPDKMDDQAQEKIIQNKTTKLAKVMGFGRNVIPREHRIKSYKHKAYEVACQTDPVEFGEIQFGYQDAEESQAMNMEEMRVDAGTDAPKFIILNVLPGTIKPSDIPTAPPDDYPSSRIKTLVNKIKTENEKSGDAQKNSSHLQQVMERFALLRGRGHLADEVVEIRKQKLDNDDEDRQSTEGVDAKPEEAFTAFKSKQDQMNFFEQTVDEQKKLKLALEGKDMPDLGIQTRNDSPLKELASLENVKKNSLDDHQRNRDHHRNKEDDAKSTRTGKSKVSRRPRRHDSSPNAHLQNHSPEHPKTPKTVGRRQSREDIAIDDTKSHKTMKSKSHRSKKSKKSEAKHKKSVTHKSVKSKTTSKRRRKEIEDEQDDADLSQKGKPTTAEKMMAMNERLDRSDRSPNQSLLNDSSFDASLSDDDEESEEEDDFVTLQEFEDFKFSSTKQIAELKGLCETTLKEKNRLLAQISSVDWTIVSQSEKKLSYVLGEFQLTMDALLLSIESDIKQWKRQWAEVETKYETITIQQKNLAAVSDFLKAEYFASNDDNWSLQEGIIKFMQTQVGLSVSDELDKQNISLVGQKEVSDTLKHSEAESCNQTLTLDPGCKACKCNSISDRRTLLQNLKIACLMYKPSPVLIPEVSDNLLPRSDVVNMQKSISDQLVTITQQRHIRLKHSKKKLLQIEDQVRQTKLPRDMNAESPRYLQDAEDKTFKDLNFLSLDNITPVSGRHQHRANLNITINNNNTSLVMSPISDNKLNESMGPLPSKTVLQDSTQLLQQMRKPILQGKINSRAVLGLKESLNTLTGTGGAGKGNETTLKLKSLNEKSSKLINQFQRASKVQLTTAQVNRRTQALSSANEEAKQQVVNQNNLLQSSASRSGDGQSSARKRNFTSSIPRDEINASPRLKPKKIPCGLNNDSQIKLSRDKNKTTQWAVNEDMRNMMMNSDSAELPEIGGMRTSYEKSSFWPDHKRGAVGKSAVNNMTLNSARTSNLNDASVDGGEGGQTPRGGHSSHRRIGSSTNRGQTVTATTTLPRRSKQMLNQQSTKGDILQVCDLEGSMDILSAEVGHHSARGGMSRGAIQEVSDLPPPQRGIKVEVRNSKAMSPSQNGIQLVTDQEIRLARRNVNTLQSKSSKVRTHADSTMNAK